LNKINSLEKEWEKCQLLNFNHFNSGNFIWLQTLIQMKLYPRVGLTKVPFKGVKLVSMTKDDLKIFLKLALYLNQEKLIENQLSDLDVSQLEEPEVRDLVGQIFFRLGYLAKSYRYVEDLTSPNSENIKGNLYVLRKKYEFAYAQFKLALEKKQNSQNAMERILPLAWLLGDWEEGAKITQRVIASPQTQINKLTLVAAFFTQKGDYDNAKAVIDTVISKSRKGLEIDVTQLHSFVGLMQNESQVVKKQASLSCAQYDLINCWLGLQMEQWDSYPLTIRRPDKVQIKKEWEKLMLLNNTITNNFTFDINKNIEINDLNINDVN
jgi:tetratricopeptide (TPR) repeat protein